MRLAPALPLPAAVLCCAVLAGCGGNGGSSTSGPPVRVTITGPHDLGTFRGSSVEVRGTVVPKGAAVTVRGERAANRGGAFLAHVSLAPGVNVIDVVARAPDARPALTAVRVQRITTVAVPDVVGLAPDEASQAITDVGLKADVQQQDGSLLDEIFGSGLRVCETSPTAQEQADPGATVTVTVARGC